MALIVTNNFQFILDKNENLLDALEHTGHEVEYQCRAGYCGSCRTKIRSGTEHVTYEEFPLAFVGRDEILPCCCKVQGQIEIDCTQEKLPAGVQPGLFPEDKAIPPQGKDNAENAVTKQTAQPPRPHAAPEVAESQASDTHTTQFTLQQQEVG